MKSHKLGRYEVQNQYLFRKEAIKRRKGQDVESARQHSFSNHVCLQDGTQVQVCKKKLCDRHAIGKCRLEKLTTKMTAGTLVASDGHGKHKNRPHSIAEEEKNQGTYQQISP